MIWYETLNRVLADFAHSIQVSAGTVATPVLRVISVLGNGGAIFIAAAVVFLLFRKTRTTGISALIALLIGALVTNLLLKNVIARERPFVDENFVYFTYWLNTGSMAASGYSFPSGHTTAAMAFATALFLHGNKKNILAGLSDPAFNGIFKNLFQRAFLYRRPGRHGCGACCRHSCLGSRSPASEKQIFCKIRAGAGNCRIYPFQARKRPITACNARGESAVVQSIFRLLQFSCSVSCKPR